MANTEIIDNIDISYMITIENLVNGLFFGTVQANRDLTTQGYTINEVKEKLSKLIKWKLI